jgi:hypothetical protein
MLVKLGQSTMVETGETLSDLMRGHIDTGMQYRAIMRLIQEKSGATPQKKLLNWILQHPEQDRFVAQIFHGCLRPRLSYFSWAVDPPQWSTGAVKVYFSSSAPRPSEKTQSLVGAC